MAQRSKVARAIDAGFGNIKFTLEKDGVVGYDCFPSIALPSAAEAVNDGTKKLDTMRVLVGGSFYEVGRAIEKNMGGDEFGRDMTDAYYDSDVYHALMRGALSYMGEKEIDALVLGLPMNHFVNQARVDRLTAQYTGEIQLTHDTSVKIHTVQVQPQPLGGFLSLGEKLDALNDAIKKYPEAGMSPITSEDELMDCTVLVVDPGAYTLDWLVINDGSAIEKVSGACSDSGRMRVCTEVANVLAAELGSPIGASFRQDIDDALRLKRPFRYAGRHHDLSQKQYQDAIKRAVRDPVNQMFQSLRGYDKRLDMVVVVGGAPAAVAQAIRETRPNLPLYVGDEAGSGSSSMFANLSGFQGLAENLIR